MSTSNLARAVYDNMVAAYWNLAVGLGGYAIEVQGATFVWAGREVAQFNLALIPPGERATAGTLSTAADFFGTLTGPWYLVLPSNAAAPPSYEPHHVERAMVCENLVPGRAEHDGAASIRRARSPAELELATLLTLEAFGLPAAALRPAHKLSSTPRRPWDRPAETYLLTLNGEVAATLTLNFFAGEAGIYGVATRPGHRGQGLAQRLVQHAHAAALSYGYPRTVLQAVPGAERVYAKAGFETVELFTHYRPV